MTRIVPLSGSFPTVIHTHQSFRLQTYLNLYRDIPIDEPYHGSWSTSSEDFVPKSASQHSREELSSHRTRLSPPVVRSMPLCTHIDHQLRVLLGTLREEGELDNTIICFTSDHGDMLGNHGMWAKRLFYEYSANIPMILLGVAWG